MVSLPTCLKTREVSIERTSHPNRFQSEWLISAYETLVPWSSRRGPLPTPRSRPEAESDQTKKESS